MKNLYVDILHSQRPKHTGLYILRDINSTADYVRAKDPKAYVRYVSKQDIEEYIEQLKPIDKELLKFTCSTLEAFITNAKDYIKSKQA